jgi:phasin family protein
MVTKPEQLSELQRKNLEAAMRLAQLSIENSQRIMELQVDTAKSLFQDGVKNAKALAEARDPQTVMSLRTDFARETTERMLGCARKIAEITTSTQAEFGRMVSEQLTTGSKEFMEAMQKAMSGMPITTHNVPESFQAAMNTAKSAFDQITKASTEAFSTFTGLANQAGKGKGDK